MKKYKLCITALLGSAVSMAAYAQDDAGEDEVFTLSPFVITPEDNVGYQATSTLAGSRLKTNLRDVGSSIQIITEELFEDTGATDAETLLSYTTSTEVGGVSGNFAGTETLRGRPFQREILRNSQNNQRVRGLDRAALSRGFFLTEIPFDSYNSDRVTIQRGPNSLLFGLSSPGGVINNNLRTPIFEDAHELSFRVGQYGSTRLTLDVNKALIEDRLAIRFNGLAEETEYKQKPAFEEDDRIYGALEYRLRKNEDSWLGNTTLSASFEAGTIGGIQPQVIPPGDAFSSWWTPRSRDLEVLTGTTLDPRGVENFVPQTTIDNRTNGAAGSGADTSLRLSPLFRQFMFVYDSPTATETGIRGTPYDGQMGTLLRSPRWLYYGTDSLYQAGELPGFTGFVIQDRAIFDYENRLLWGNQPLTERDINAHTFGLEQSLFGGKAGFRVDYDMQETEVFFRESFINVNNRDQDIQIDITEYMNDGTPNPNLGRAFVKTRPYTQTQRDTTQLETFRATAFADVDFTSRDGWASWLGKHTLTGFFSDYTRDDSRVQDRLSVGSNDFTIGNAVGGPPGGFGRLPNLFVYVSDPLFDVSSPSGVRLYDESFNFPVFEDGDTFNVLYYDRPADEVTSGEVFIERVDRPGSLGRQEIESRQFSIQSSFLGGDLVVIAGWREDDLTRYNSEALPDSVDRILDTVPDPASDLTQDLDSDTRSIVYHFQEDDLFELPFGMDLSFHFNESTAIEPFVGRRTLLNEPLSSPQSDTTEYGFSLQFLERRLTARFNWFETTRSNSTAPSTPEFQYLTWTGENWLNRFQEAEDDGVVFNTIDGVSGRYSSYDEIRTAIINLMPTATRNAANPTFNSSTGQWEVDSDFQGAATATTESISEGFELELVGSLTSNWNVSLNVAQQETVTDNTAPIFSQIYNETLANIRAGGFDQIHDSPNAPGDATTTNFESRLNSVVGVFLNAEIAKDGQIQAEQREWRVNMTTNYSFNDGRFKGVGIGGAIRWQDGAATGYPTFINSDGIQLPDVANPFISGSQWNGDIWASYKRKLSDHVDWKIQLNIRNAIGNDDPYPVTTNPDGQLAVIRIPSPREWLITNTFSF